MSERVNALFSGDIPPPPNDHGPRLRTIEQTLWVAIALNVLGIPCWTSVPGALLTLWVWLATDADTALTSNGNMSSADTAHLARLRRRSTATLIFCIAALLIQILLLSTTFYERLWGSASVAIQHVWQAI